MNYDKATTMSRGFNFAIERESTLHFLADLFGDKEIIFLYLQQSTEGMVIWPLVLSSALGALFFYVVDRIEEIDYSFLSIILNLYIPSHIQSNPFSV